MITCIIDQITLVKLKSLIDIALSNSYNSEVSIINSYGAPFKKKINARRLKFKRDKLTQISKSALLPPNLIEHNIESIKDFLSHCYRTQMLIFSIAPPNSPTLYLLQLLTPDGFGTYFHHSQI